MDGSVTPVVLVSGGPDDGLVWHAGHPMTEQRAMETGRGVLDWSNRGVVTITGPDRLSWLHSLTSQHLASVTSGQGFEALVLSPTGHVEHILHGVDDGTTVWAWTEPGRAGELVGWLDRMRFMTRVEVADRSQDCTLLWLGEDEELPQGSLAVRPSAVGRGREVFWPRAADVPAGTPVGTWAHEALRIAAGLPRIGIDTDHKTIPNEIGLLGTHLDKGCYRGQETVARVHTLGRPPRRLVQLLLDGSVEALPEAGGALLADDRAVGLVGSSARHHELGPIALAMVKRSVPVEATLVAPTAGGEQIAASQQVLVDPEVGLHVRPRLS